MTQVHLLLILTTACACALMATGCTGADETTPDSARTQSTEVDLYAPAACSDPVSCVEPFTADGDLGPLTFVAARWGINDSVGGHCAVAVGLCSVLRDSDVLAIASYTSAPTEIPYTCAEPGRYGIPMYKVPLQVHGALGTVALPKIMTAVAPLDDEWKNEWQGRFLANFRFIDGDWMILSRWTGTSAANSPSVTGTPC